MKLICKINVTDDGKTFYNFYIETELGVRIPIKPTFNNSLITLYEIADKEINKKEV